MDVLLLNHFFPSSFSNLQRVLNSIWEILEGTDGDGLLGWILAGAVRLCKERDDNLDVAFSAQSSRFKQGFSVVDTPSIHIHTYENANINCKFLLVN